MSEQFIPEILFTGDFPNVTQDPVTLVSGQGLVKRGTALGKVTATEKLKILNSLSTDGSEVIYGILGQDADTSSGDANSFVYLTGEFNQSYVVFGGTDTYKKHEEAARLRGIFFKPVKP